MKKYYFKKEERLCSLKLIEELYSQGSSFALYPFRFVYREIQPQTPPIQIVISVPKRKFKKAVDRNKIKRQIREVYRHSKEDFLYLSLIEKGKSLHLLIIFTGNEIITTSTIRKKLNLGLERLLTKL
jgi:ribonuclease P protein component